MPNVGLCLHVILEYSEVILSIPFFLLSSYQTLVNRKVIGPLRVYALVPVCLDILFPSVTVNVGLLPVRILKEFFGIRFC